jgi:hypothetical protein
MKRLIIGLGMFFIWLFVTAATPASEASALAISGVAGVILSLLVKYVPAAGRWMVGITLGLSLLVAIAAEVATGEIVLSNLQSASPATLFATFMSAWGLSQLTYAWLTQSPKTVKAVV